MQDRADPRSALAEGCVAHAPPRSRPRRRRNAAPSSARDVRARRRTARREALARRRAACRACGYGRIPRERASGHQLPTKKRSKNRSGEPKRSRAHPHRRVPLTSARRQAEALDRTPGVLSSRTLDRLFDRQPVTHHRDVAERARRSAPSRTGRDSCRRAEPRFLAVRIARRSARSSRRA